MNHKVHSLIIFMANPFRLPFEHAHCVHFCALYMHTVYTEAQVLVHERAPSDTTFWHGLSFIARGSSVMEKHCPLGDMPYSSKASHAMKPSTAVLSGVNWYLFTHDDLTSSPRVRKSRMTMHMYPVGSLNPLLPTAASPRSVPSEVNRSWSMKL